MRRLVWQAIRGVRYAVLVAAALSYSPPASAQAPVADRRVSGTVTEGTGRPLAHALVSGPGVTAVRTDEQGRFATSVPAGPATLIVRAIGYSPREIRLEPDRSELTVVLTAQPYTLGEITISGGESDLKKVTATTAGAEVSSEQVTRAPSQSIEQALQGKILGASINLNTGAPGGGGQIQIRGTSSILGNGEPLIVIDGIISSNDAFSAGASTVTRGGTNQDQNVNRLADINPAEIESIEIVKDASATAIYGSRASNGVVVIRTKRGRSGGTEFNFTQRLGIARPLRYVGYRTFSTVAEVQGLRFGATANAAATAYLQSHFPDGTIPASANVDLEGDFFDNTKPAYETTLSASGGSGGTRYFASLTNRNEEGIAINTNARLQSLRLNVDQTLSKRLTASLNLNAIRNVLNRGLANNDNSFTSPVYAFAYTPAVFDLEERDAGGNFVRNPIFGGGNSASNPFETYTYLKYTQDVWRQLGSLTVSYTALDRTSDRVVASLLGGFDRYEQSGDLFSPGFLQYEGRNNLFGTSEQATVNGLNYNVQPLVTWTHAPSSKLTFMTAVGGSIERQSTNNYAIVGRGLVPGSELAAQGTITATQGITEFRDQALFASEQVTALDERLVLNAGVRADRSSANGDPSHFYLFPRVSGAYRFLNPVAHIDELKLRAGWGQTGNRPRYGDRDITLDNGGVVQGQSSVQVASVVGNPTIKPETLTEVSGGFDLTALGGRVALEATYYRRTISDLLLQPSAAPSTGFTTLVINAGKLRNQGVELALSATPLQSKTTSWFSRITFQKKNERVIDLSASVSPFTPASSFGASFGRNRVTAGYETSAIWGNVPVDAQGHILPVGSYVTNPTAIAGRVDTTIGNANPNFQVFFENTVTWKAFSLGFTLDWRSGGDVANTTTKLYDEGGTSRDFTTPVTADNVPRGTPAASLASIPSTILGLGDFRYQAWSGGSDARIYLQDGSYLRLRDISLTYTAPRSAARLLRASVLRVSLQARNVLMWTKYWGYDPEFNNFGNQNVNRFIDTAPYPGARSFYVSLNLVY